MDHGLNIKLSDFGFARGHMKPKNGVYALSETFCGSYAYASPEILKGVPYRPQDSDIWSMGVVLYAIVYGRLPFDDTNYTQLLKVYLYIDCLYTLIFERLLLLNFTASPKQGVLPSRTESVN